MYVMVIESLEGIGDEIIYGPYRKYSIAQKAMYKALDDWFIDSKDCMSGIELTTHKDEYTVSVRSESGQRLEYLSHVTPIRKYPNGK